MDYGLISQLPINEFPEHCELYLSCAVMEVVREFVKYMYS